MKQVRSVRQCAQFTAFGGVSLGLVVCGFITDPYAAYSCMIIVQVDLIIPYYYLLNENSKSSIVM